MKTSETVSELYKDYILAQVELKNIAKDKKGQYKYTSLDKLIEETKPILQKHNLAILQMPVLNGLTSRLIHSSGEWIETVLEGDSGEPRGMNILQLQGSQLTYYRRYSWASICGIASDEDLDANAPKENNSHSEKDVNNSHSNFTPDKVSASQVKLIQTRLSKMPDRETNETALKAHYKIESWNDLPAQSIQGLLDWFEKNGV